jgi:hypothetical protein
MSWNQYLPAQLLLALQAAGAPSEPRRAPQASPSSASNCPTAAAHECQQPPQHLLLLLPLLLQLLLLQGWCACWQQRWCRWALMLLMLLLTWMLMWHCLCAV